MVPVGLFGLQTKTSRVRGVSAAAIFLPSFLFVLLLHRVLPWLRRWPATAAFLDAVNASAVGLMAAVTIKLTLATLVDLPSLAIALVALLVALRWKVGAAWLVLGGALAGWLMH